MAVSVVNTCSSGTSLRADFVTDSIVSTRSLGVVLPAGRNRAPQDSREGSHSRADRNRVGCMQERYFITDYAEISIPACDPHHRITRRIASVQPGGIVAILSNMSMRTPYKARGLFRPLNWLKGY